MSDLQSELTEQLQELKSFLYEVMCTDPTMKTITFYYQDGSEIEVKFKEGLNE